ncbi:MAG: PEP-CTERM sorting domain-containing protein [Akkermansiaceae bacterium]|jgi:hypothetical protein|nr:PEP-CTERM sorting domain-containing protein [Akkermansiaceae bacterium]
MKTFPFLLLPLLFAQAQAATIVAGNVTTTLGPNFFFDSASIGGGDTNAAATAVFARNFGALTVGAGGTTVSITGFGFAAGAGVITATEVSMTITYLGANGVFGGGDDVVMGTVTDSITGIGTGSEYVWSFDTPMVQVLDGLGSTFRFDLTTNGTGNLRFKTTSGTSAASAKLSVSGTSAAVVPEPTFAMLAGLGIIGILRRRR